MNAYDIITVTASGKSFPGHLSDAQEQELANTNLPWTVQVGTVPVAFVDQDKYGELLPIFNHRENPADIGHLSDILRFVTSELEGKTR